MMKKYKAPVIQEPEAPEVKPEPPRVIEIPSIEFAATAMNEAVIRQTMIVSELVKLMSGMETSGKKIHVKIIRDTRGNMDQLIISPLKDGP